MSGSHDVSESPSPSTQVVDTYERCVLVVGLGASAGGLEALERFFANAPLDLGIAYIVIQHLTPHQPSLLAHILAGHTRMQVVEIVDPIVMKPDHVYIVQGGTTVSLSSGTLQHSSTANVDHGGQINAVFRVLAEDQRERAVGIILSGTGADGTEGLRVIKAHGGRTLAQLPETAKYPAMPNHAIAAEVVDAVLSVDDMLPYLAEHAASVDTPVVIDESSVEVTTPTDEQIMSSLGRICDVLRRTTGRDFSQYKRGTVMRRLRHRLQRRRVASFDEYLDILDKDVREPELLSKDLLVGVTQFFRDPEAFEYLDLFVLPEILASAASREGVRIWVPGCASGEEAYSIGILLRERFASMGAAPSVQIFATDIDPDAIAEARAGRYPESIAEHVSAERLAQFFTHDKSSFQVTKEVREMCVFSDHNLIRDPPFLGLDLISCRNVLIYLEAGLQKKLVPVFHYALRRGGYLLLGPSEGLAGYTELFHTMDKRHRVFQRAEAISRPVLEWPVTPHMVPRVVKPSMREPAVPPMQEQAINSTFERLLLQDYVPPSAVVNEHGEIVCVAGLTGPYFQPPAGLLTTNILEIAHASLRIELRTALHAVSRSGTKIARDDIMVEIEGVPRRVRLTVRPMPRLEHGGLYVVIIQEQRELAEIIEAPTMTVVRESAMEQLEGELRRTRASLRATIEELESANEELKSSNEELLSMNEEMQSSNEELQSSQEELKSVNEELATVNAELGRRIEELAHANADLQTLFSSTDVATLFLDRERRVMKFTPAAKTLFRLIDADSGRPLADLAPRFHDCDLSVDVMGVLKTLQTVERQVQTVDRNAWYLLRILPYRALNHDVLGAVVTLIDITQSKRLEAESERLVIELRTAQEQLRVDLDATTKLLKIGSLFMRGGNMALVLDDILDAAIAISGADFGDVQLLERKSGQLRIMAHRGLTRAWVEFWSNASSASGSYAKALSVGQRVIVEDVETSALYAGSRALDVQLQSGIRAVQSTPLVARSGELLGIISTHYKTRGRPNEHALRLLDLVARQTADILERAYAEEAIHESERRFRALLDATMDIPYRMNADWTVMQQLEGRGVMADTTNADRRWLEKYIHPDDQARLVECIGEAIRTKSIFQLEHRILRADGSFGWTSSRAAPLLNDQGNIVEWFGIARDTTERKQAEIDLKEANQRLRETDQRKNEFLGMLSHELRNPLAAIVTSLHLTEKTPPGSDVFARAHAVICRQTYHLNRLVDDLLDTTRLTRGKIQLQKEHLDLHELVQLVVDDYRNLFDQHRVKLDCQSDSTAIWVHGDRVRLAQIIGNLLQNAVKFTPAGGTTRVVLESTTNHAKVHVRDTGAGLNPTMLPHIFEPFTQIDATLERSRGGLGLGLAVVKGLVELHDGSVSAASDGLNKGATFTITLPLDTRKHEQASASSPDGQAETHRIVMIEDNRDAAEMLREVLELRGHEVFIAYSGTEGLELVRRVRPTAVICDIGLPEMNGYDVARAIRADESLRPLLLVALSGYGGPEDVAKAKDAGFDLHLVKPPNLVTLEQVFATMRKKSSDHST